jgi:RNA polymerase sigma factor (sigma-70 family)
LPPWPASEQEVSPWISDIFLSSQSDERLVALARAGHERAFAAIVERYRRELGAYARRLDSSDRSEDIVQQALLSAFTALRSGSEVAHLRGWLYQIVRNTAIRASARERPAAELDASLTGTESLEDAVETRMRAREVLTELGRLPTRQREAIVEMSIAGRSRAEVASTMGLTEGAVRQLTHRARVKLRSAVTALIPFPLARFLGAGSDGGASDVVMGAGAASVGGVMAKVGALVATGVVATAVVSSPLGTHHRKAAARHHVSAVAPPPRATRHGGHPVLVAGTERPVNLSSGRTSEPIALNGRGDTDRSRTGASVTRSGDDGSKGGSGSSGTGGVPSSGGSTSTEGGTGGSSGGPTATASDTGTSGTSSDGGSGIDGATQSTSIDGGSPSSSTSGSGTDGGGGGTGSGGGTSSDGGSGSTTTTSSGTSSPDGGMVSSGSGSSSSGALPTSDGGGTSGG